VVLAPGYAALTFEPPRPGTYRLPPLGAAADGRILDAAGKPLVLHDLLGDRVVVLSFVYTACSDINGCPLATHVLSEIQKRVLQSAPDLGRDLRLITLSFDPSIDTPQVMKAYGKRFEQRPFDWRFVTTDGEAALAPILDGYGQWVIKDYDSEGNYLGSMSHVLRVFLIDRQRKIRNIYSISFLHADTVLADVRTLLAESGPDS
jgi:cytochrome c peroxidase